MATEIPLQPDRLSELPSRSILLHSARAMRAVVSRELGKFAHQYGRLASAVVRPALWLVVFAAGMQNLFGVSNRT